MSYFPPLPFTLPFCFDLLSFWSFLLLTSHSSSGPTYFLPVLPLPRPLIYFSDYMLSYPISYTPSSPNSFPISTPFYFFQACPTSLTPKSNHEGKLLTLLDDVFILQLFYLLGSLWNALQNIYTIINIPVLWLQVGSEERVGIFFFFFLMGWNKILAIKGLNVKIIFFKFG